MVVHSLENSDGVATDYAPSKIRQAHARITSAATPATHRLPSRQAAGRG
jgi:hypothetical protein